MSKKVKVLVSVLVAVVLLTVGGAAAVMADDGSTATDNETGRKGLLARVAENLGITDEELANAFKQARQEMREECQATGNCTILRERVMFRDQWKEKRQEWIEKRQEIGKRFQCNGTENQQNMRLRISQSVRGRQMMAVPTGWQWTGAPELAD